jgi:hypothetical protein
MLPVASLHSLRTSGWLFAALVTAWIGIGQDGSLLAAEEAARTPSATFNYPDPPHEGKPGYFTIAESGAARCVIVRPKKGTFNDARRSAELLKVYLDLSTGASIPLIDEPAPIPAGSTVISVGDTAMGKKVPLDLPKVQYGDDAIANLNGYLVLTPDARTLIIRGETDRATALGVVGFLKRYVGVRHYWAGNPGDPGDVIPHSATLTVPELTWRDWPYFVSRSMSGISDFGPPPADPWKTVSTVDFFRLNYTIPSNESYYRWLPVAKLGETHPEYYPMFEGKRFVPPTTKDAGWQPCTSNPDSPKVVADALIEYFDKNPNAIAINLAVNDGNGDCQCEACRAMDPPGADMANRIGLCDRYIAFDNKVCDLVAKKYPEKIIAFIAYGSMRNPPERTRLHPMLMPVLTWVGNVNAFAGWDAWGKMGARRMGAYLYHDDQVFFVMPKMDIHQSAKRIAYMVAAGQARHFYQEMYPYWPLDGMVVYVENELMWDPRQNVDAILDEYYTKFFGPAAGPMKQFYDTLESGYTRWLEADGQPHPFGKDLGNLMGGMSFEQFKVLNAAEADRAGAFLGQAIGVAKDDAAVSQRLDIVRRLFDFVAFGARQYSIVEQFSSTKVQSEADAGQMVTLARKVVALARAQGKYKVEVMEQAPAKIYAAFGSSPTKPIRNDVYLNIGPDKLNPAILRGIGDGMDAVNGWLRGAFAPEAAAAWWDKQRTGEAEPIMQDVLAIARCKAAGDVVKNLIVDGGFEERGAGISPQTHRPLETDAQDHNGVHVWHRTGTPFAFEFSDEAHTGKRSAQFTECGVTVLIEAVSTPKAGRFHAEAWMKHNDPAGTYELQLMPFTAEGQQSPITIPLPAQPGEWQKVQMDYPAPAGTKSISMRIVVNGQAPGAKLWVDDLFLGRYPD